MLGLLKLIWNAIKRLFGFLGDHGDVIAKGAAVAGGAAAAVGAGAGIRANRINKKALAMREEALSAFQESNAETEAREQRRQRPDQVPHRSGRKLRIC